MLRRQLRLLLFNKGHTTINLRIPDCLNTYSTTAAVVTSFDCYKSCSPNYFHHSCHHFSRSSIEYSKVAVAVCDDAVAIITVKVILSKDHINASFKVMPQDYIDFKAITIDEASELSNFSCKCFSFCILKLVPYDTEA